MVEIILLAMVAIFVGLRLFSVLGQRTGHEQTPIVRPIEPPALTPIPATAREAPRIQPETPDSVIAPAAAIGMRGIVAADPRFDVEEFLEGAKSAYRMILEAFWKGAEDDLAHLADESVRASFAEAIAARVAEGHVLDNRLVTIENVLIESAAMEGQTARITLRFDADIAAVTRDREGNVIAGSMSDAVPTHDVWTFARNVRESDPNWQLVDTDEAA
ncbi:MAG: Tim44 domain-containing protein [Sphingomonadaceae bacterium]|nr:Tim44 domain-containing protein [Sphingomonadaceae bacterium]